MLNEALDDFRTKKVKDLGNNNYEVKYKDIYSGKTKKMFIKVKPEDSSYTIIYAKDKNVKDDDLLSFYCKLDEKGRAVKNKYIEYGGFTETIEVERDSRGNIVKTINDGTNGYSCETCTFNDNKRPTSRVITDKKGNQISATTWAYDAKGRDTNIKIYGKDKNTPQTERTFEYSKDDVNMTITETQAPKSAEDKGVKIVKKCQKPNVGGDWYSDYHLMMSEERYEGDTLVQTKKCSYKKAYDKNGHENTLVTVKSYDASGKLINQAQEEVHGLYEYVY